MIDVNDFYTGDIFMFDNKSIPATSVGFSFSDADLVIIAQGVDMLLASLSRQRNSHPLGSTIYNAFDDRIKQVNAVSLKLGGR